MADPASPVPLSLLGREAIHLHALRLWAHVGVLERERELGQWFELSLSLWHDLGPAGRSDDLSTASITAWRSGHCRSRHAQSTASPWSITPSG